jgi:O-antigen ligase
MNLFAKLSTLPMLGWYAFSALVFNDEALLVHLGSFKLSVFDFLFVGMCLVKFSRLAEPGAYQLPTGRIGTVLMFNVLAVIYLLISAGHQPGIETGDVLRDLRVVFYFLLIPFICYKDIDSPNAYRKVQMYLVGAGVAVSLYMLAEQLHGFSVANPVRDVRLGVWVIPFSVVSLLYFRADLKLKVSTAYAMILFMMMALVFSLNRSQYLQLLFSIGMAMVLGRQVNAMRRGLALFVPALVAGLVLFYAMGYLDILIERVVSVDDLQNDSSYGSRVQEYVGQMEFFRQSPIFGNGAGFRSWVMGEDGFELSTFAHNSWAFYLMKFGIVGTVLIMWPCLLLMIFAMIRPYRDARLELHRRYLIACMPVYVFVDSLSGGLAYAPKTAFTGFLLCYALSLLRNDVSWSPLHRPAPRTLATTVMTHAAQVRPRALVRTSSIKAIRNG